MEMLFLIFLHGDVIFEVKEDFIELVITNFSVYVSMTY